MQEDGPSSLAGALATPRNRGILTASLGCLLLLALLLTGLSREGIERSTLVSDDWTSDEPAGAPGPGWRQGPRGLRAGPEGALLVLPLPARPDRPAWARIEGRNVHGVLSSGDGDRRPGRHRLVRPGRAVVLRPRPPGGATLAVRAEPGGVLERLEAGITVQGVLPPIPYGWLAVLVAAAAAAAAWPGRRAPREIRAAWLRGALVGMAAAVSFAYAFSWFANLALEDPEPDLLAFHGIAGALSHPLDTAYREPLWPWLLRLWWLVAGETTVADRLLGVLLAPLAVPATAFLLRRLHASPWVAVAGAWLVAGHDLLAHMAGRGLRTPLYVLLVTVFLGLCAQRRERAHIGPWLLIGLVAGLLGLVRLESVLLVALAVPVALWRGRIRDAWSGLPWKGLGAAAGLTATLLAPGLVWNLARHGDPLYPLSHTARGKANRIAWEESAGAPDRVDAATLYAGEEVGPAELLLERVGPLETIRRWLVGTMKLLGDPRSLQLRWLFGAAPRRWLVFVIWPLWIAGLVLWACSKRRWGLWLLPASLHVIPVFAADVVEPRLVAHLIPLLAGAVALALVSGIRLLSSLPPGWHSCKRF